MGINSGNYKSWKVGRGESIKSSFRVLDFNWPFWRLTFLFKVELVDLGLEGQVCKSCLLSQNGNFLRNALNGQLNWQKVSPSQKPQLRDVYAC